MKKNLIHGLICGALIGSMVLWSASTGGYDDFFKKAEAVEITPEMRSGMPCDLKEETPIYTVSGSLLPVEYQEYIYKVMQDRGCASYYKYWLCEIFQESAFDPACTDGQSYGLCQLNGEYHDWFCHRAGLPEGTDLVNDVYANLYAGTTFFCDNLINYEFDIEMAVKKYMNGTDSQNRTYWMDVSRWYDQAVRIN